MPSVAVHRETLRLHRLAIDGDVFEDHPGSVPNADGRTSASRVDDREPGHRDVRDGHLGQAVNCDDAAGGRGDLDVLDGEVAVAPGEKKEKPRILISNKQARCNFKL